MSGGISNKNFDFFLLIVGSYVLTSTLAKYLHELGHALVAVYLGVRISNMTIVVNPFGSGYFRPTDFGFPTSALENGTFAIAGAIFPIIVLSVLYFFTRRHGRVTRWLVGMLFGYSMLSNAANLVSGFFMRASDGGYLLFIGFPAVFLGVLCAAMGLLGAIVLVTDNFRPILYSVRGLGSQVIVCSGFLVSAVLGVALVGLLDDSLRRRLFFSSFESLLLAVLFVATLTTTRKKEREFTPEFNANLSLQAWVLFTIGATVAGLSTVYYASSRIV